MPFLCTIVRIIWKEKFRIRAEQVSSLRAFLGIRRMDKVPSARIREFCGVTKEVDERIYVGLFMMVRACGENDRVYVWERAGSRKR